MSNMKPMFLALVILMVNSTYCQAQNSEIKLRKIHFNIDVSGTAVQGYDPVSYFSGKPKKGVSTITYKHNGVIYMFESGKNLTLFKKSPDTFEPMYGGWCAYAMGAKGEKVEVDVETYKIINGRLYLFYNSFFNNTLTKWNKYESNLNKNANDNWSKQYK